MGLILGNYKQADGGGTDYHGCTLERHPDEIGTIIEYKSYSGEYKHFVILNAEYWPTELQTCSIKNTNITVINTIVDTNYLGDQYPRWVALPETITTEFIQARFIENVIQDIGRANDLLSLDLNYIKAIPALNFCYNLNVKKYGTGYATIPNLLEVANIWLIWDQLIKIDPTYTTWVTKQNIQLNRSSAFSYRLLNISCVSSNIRTNKTNYVIRPVGDIAYFRDTSIKGFFIPIRELD